MHKIPLDPKIHPPKTRFYAVATTLSLGVSGMIDLHQRGDGVLPHCLGPRSSSQIDDEVTLPLPEEKKEKMKSNMARMMRQQQTFRI